MQIDIFDVAHGACALLTLDNGKRLLVDCGDDEPRFSPSQHLLDLGCSALEALFISNFDQDHVSDICSLLDNVRVRALFRNKTVPMDWLVREKRAQGGLSTAMARTVAMANEYNAPLISPLDVGALNHAAFYASYPTFLDTNNLSVLSFFSLDSFTIAFTGDLERAGWLHHLENEEVKRWLRMTTVFVASHHGRIGGYCEEVFQFAKPEVVLISDKDVVHDTQVNSYTRHASGILRNGGPDRRYCLTTRNDGHIRIVKQVGQGYHITTSR